MAKLKRIGVLSLASMQGVLMAIFGLIAGLFYAIIMLIFSSLLGSSGAGIGLGILAIIGIPIVYGILGFISGAIFAALYNLVAGWIGGVEMDFQ